MKRRALFIGIDEYDDPQIRNLRFSRIDAHSLNELFADVGYDVRYLPNPTKAEVLAAVRERSAYIAVAAGDPLAHSSAALRVAVCSCRTSA